MFCIFLQAKPSKAQKSHVTNQTNETNNWDHIKNDILRQEIIDISKLVPPVHIFHALDRECKFAIELSDNIECHYKAHLFTHKINT